MARHKITPSEEKQIRTLLNLAPDAPFPRCVGRDKDKLRDLESAGDYSHSGRGHSCPDCQCESIAGEGTRGDDYGLGLNVGHWGCGLCCECEKSVRADSRERIWKEHFKVMTTTGMVVSTDQYEQKAVAEANQAVTNMEVKDAILLVRDSIAEFKRLHDGEGLTEKGPGGPQPMSDGTRLKLMLEQAKVLNELGKTAFEFNRDLHIPMDVMKVWVVKILQLGQKYCMTRKQYDEFAADLKKIMSETRNPNLMMADTEVRADMMPKGANE